MRRLPRRAAGPLLLVVTLASLVAADRVLLAYYGRPIWEYDPVLLWRHRVNAVGVWEPWMGGKPIRINRWGFHDDDFPLAKPAGEFRAVVLGDSIVMGHGVSEDETFSNQLEDRLSARWQGLRSVQIIDAGVQGYGTAQYPEALRRALRFAPQLVVVGFCMNDVLGPYMADPARGGTWHAFRQVAETTNPVLSWLTTESGFGRLALALRSRWSTPEHLRRKQRYSVEWMAANTGKDAFLEQEWRRVLGELDALYAEARRAGLPVVLLVFAHTFQLGHPELQEPQRVVARHAAERGVPLLDVGALFERRRQADATPLYLDDNHFVPHGHAVVAAALEQFLDRNALLGE